jgi:hypothetical protein
VAVAVAPVLRPVLASTTVSARADYEQDTVVLGVQLAVGGDGERRIRRTDCLLQKHPLFLRAALVDRVDEAVLAVVIDHPVSVDRGRVDAPLEAVGVVGPPAGALELPLYAQVTAQLGDEVGARWWGSRGRAAVGVVVVVLDRDRVAPAVLVDRRRGIPAEVEGALEGAGGAELEQVTAGEVVAGVSAVEHRPVRRYCRRRGGLVDHASGRQFSRGRVDAGRVLAGIERAADARVHAAIHGQQHPAAVGEMTTQ